MGSGLAVFDYDGDGDLDVYFVNADAHPSVDSGNRLFRRDADGVFRDATMEAGLGDTGYGMGTALGDIDNDGDLDLLVTNDGPNRLYRNNADGTFSDITESAGIEGSRWSTSAAFCDIDDDGLLDLYIANYVTNEPPYACASGTGEPDYCGPNAYRGVPDRLYRNDGTRFVDISAASGIARTARNGLGVVCFDFDGDARDDFLVANDGERNQLWINEGDGKFVDRGVRFGIATNIEGDTEASMGVALGDVDGDLRLDALMTHLGGETNTLYLADPMGMLLDSSALAGVGFPSVADTGFGVALADLDQDADLDLGRGERPGAARCRLDRPAKRRGAARCLRATLRRTQSAHGEQRPGLVRRSLRGDPQFLRHHGSESRTARRRHRCRWRPRHPRHQRQRARAPVPERHPRQGELAQTAHRRSRPESGGHRCHGARPPRGYLADKAGDSCHQLPLQCRRGSAFRTGTRAGRRRDRRDLARRRAASGFREPARTDRP